MSSPTTLVPISSASIAGSREEWMVQREKLREQEKAHARQKDELARQRKQLPWLPVEQDFLLENCSANTTSGDAKNATKLSQLFGSHRQLLVYDMMSFDETKGYPCVACSLIVEQLSAIYDHLSKHSSVVVICHGPPERLRICSKLREWKVPVYACGPEFAKFIGSEGHPRIEPTGWGSPPSRSAMSAFAKGAPDGTNQEQVYLTYATWERGVEDVELCCNWIDRAPFDIKGARQPGFLQWRSLYGDPGPLPAEKVKSCCQ